MCSLVKYACSSQTVFRATLAGLLLAARKVEGKNKYRLLAGKLELLDDVEGNWGTLLITVNKRR
jgi:hypothetical protein